MSTTDTRNPTGDEGFTGTWNDSSSGGSPGSGTGYTFVNDYPDSATNYLIHGTTAGQGLFTYSAFTVPAGSTINNVTVSYYDKDNTLGTNNLAACLKVHGSYYSASSHDPSTTTTLRQDVFTTNPETSSAWTVNDVNGSGSTPLQAFGVISSDANPSIRLYSIQISVNYDVPVSNFDSASTLGAVTMAGVETGADFDSASTIGAVTMTATMTVPGALSSTATWLQNKDWADIALCLVFEGYNLIYTTHSDVSGLQSAWGAASQWSVVKGGLMPPGGQIAQQIEPFVAKVPMPGMSFSILDHDDTLIGLMMKEAATTAATDLTSSVDSDDLAWPALDTTGFSSSGYVYCGIEEAAYSAKSSTSFTISERGVRSLFGRQANAYFGQPHEVDVDTGFRPRICQTPPFWIGRRVALYACHKYDGTWTAGLTGSSGADAECLWAGRIDGITEDGAGVVSIDCSAIAQMLKTTLLARQFKGYVQDGLWLDAARADMKITAVRIYSTGPTVSVEGDDRVATIGGTGAFRTHSEVADRIRAQMLAWYSGTSNSYRFDIRQGSSTTQPNVYSIDVYDNKSPTLRATDQLTVKVFLHPDVWTFLGFDTTSGEQTTDSNGRSLCGLKLEARDDADVKHFTRTAEGPPRRGLAAGINGSSAATLTITDVVSGTDFINQPTIPPQFNANVTGFLRLAGKYILAVKKVSNTSYTVYDVLGDKFMPIGLSNPDGGSVFQVLDNTSGDKILAEQVWLEAGSVSSIFWQLLLSTGTSGYNHSTADVYGKGMGVGVPYTLLNANSFLGLGASDPYVLFLEKPESFIGLFEKALSASNQHCVWANGKLKIVRGAEESAYASSIVTLTEANKAVQVKPGSARAPNSQRTRCYRTLDYLINRTTIKFQRVMGGDYARQYTVNNTASQSDFGQIRSVVVEAPGMYEDFDLVGNGALAGWAQRCVAQELAYWGRPMAVLDRSYDFNLATKIYPGARVRIQDSALVNPVDGTRGVTGVLGWVLSHSFDWWTGVGTCKVAFPPEFAAAKLGAYAPSARIDDTLSSGGYSRGYNAGTKTLSCLANAYSDPADTYADAANFPAGSKVHVVQLSPDDPNHPTEWTDTVASQSGNTITLTTGLSSPAWPSSGYFVIESDVVTNATTTQKTNFAYHASPSTLSTGASTRDYYIWSGAPELYKNDTSVYTTRYRKPVVASYATGSPVSAHKYYDAVAWLDTALSYHTANPLITWSRGTQIGGSVPYLSTSDTSNFVMLVGPSWCPLYGGARPLKIKVRRKNNSSSAATIRVVSSTGIMRGQADSAAGDSHKNTYTDGFWPDGGSHYADISVTGSASLDWSSEVSLTPAVLGGAVAGCWITVHAKAGAAGAIELHQVSVLEGPQT